MEQAAARMGQLEPKLKARWFTLPRIFAGLSLVFGMTMAVLTPPFGVPDEPHHFLRAYQISEGHLLPTFHNNTGGADLPRSIGLTGRPFDASKRQRHLTTWSQIENAMRIPLAPRDVQYYEFSNTSAYSPLPYIPQALAIAIGRPLGLTPIELMYFGRFLNLLLWIATGYLALSLVSGIRRAIFLLMLMPMAIYIAASMSADVMCNCIAIIFSVLVFRQVTDERAQKISTRRIWLLVLLAIGIGLTKFVYLPLTAFPLLIPRRAFGTTHRKRFAAAAIMGAGLIAAVIWSLQTPGLDMIANGLSRNFYPRLQVEFLRQHPSAWLTVPIQTIKYDWREQLGSFVGEFGWMEATMDPSVCSVCLLVLLWSCKPSAKERSHDSVWKWLVLIGAIVLSSLFLLGLTAYLYWNPLGSPDVKGLQGRYLVPLTPVGIMLVWRCWSALPSRYHIQKNEWRLELETALFAVAALSYAIYVIYTFFYTGYSWF
jgi:uncharacterized membrane protein